MSATTASMTTTTRAATAAGQAEPNLFWVAAIACDQQLRNSAAQREYREQNAPMVSEEDRALVLALKNSISLGNFRKAHPNPRITVGAWHALLDLRRWQAAWRRRHKHIPLNAITETP